MSPELSRETRVKLCALTTMLSSYQVRGEFGVGGSHPAHQSPVQLPQNSDSHRPGCLRFTRVLEGASGRRKVSLGKAGRWVVLKAG